MGRDKAILAYSGGLDTSVIITWLKNNYNYDVIAVCCDVGQDEDFAAIMEKAYATGASKAYVLDLKEEFIIDYIWPTLKAGAIYENDYLLGTSMARPLISKKLVEIAWEEGAAAIVHGATGKGNDQVRFEATIRAFDPFIEIIAPWRIWDLRSREDCINYARKHNIPITQTKEQIYSRDQNIWHTSHEGGSLEDPWTEHKSHIYVMSLSPENAPDQAVYVDIDFQEGIPKGIGGEAMDPLPLLQFLNKIGGQHGIGTVDTIENRLVGMKSRGVYETPGGTILYKAHNHLEKLILDRDTMAYKNLISQKYAQLLYDGLWFTPLRSAIDAFVDDTQRQVTGTVRMKLYKGNAAAVAVRSPYSLYDKSFATFEDEQVFDQKDAEGFINLFSLPLKIRAIQNQKRKEAPPK
ncbi:MAG: argininosuccinate synthase [Anaerovoracaceae bacterium]|jgi:argininosuccinate synthase